MVDSMSIIISFSFNQNNTLIYTDNSATRVTIPYELFYYQSTKPGTAYPEKTTLLPGQQGTLDIKVDVPDCSAALGLSFGVATIQNCQITASSEKGANVAANARLSNPSSTFINAPRGEPFFANEFLQVNCLDTKIWLLRNKFHSSLRMYSCCVYSELFKALKIFLTDSITGIDTRNGNRVSERARQWDFLYDIFPSAVQQQHADLAGPPRSLWTTNSNSAFS